MERAAAGRSRGEGAPPRRSPVVRTKPVRLTVDMPPALHRRLKEFTSYAAHELDVADVPAAEVVRVLVRQLTMRPTDRGYDADRVNALTELVLEEVRAQMEQ
jgi:hypothetical protein